MLWYYPLDIFTFINKMIYKEIIFPLVLAPQLLHQPRVSHKWHKALCNLVRVRITNVKDYAVLLMLYLQGAGKIPPGSTGWSGV